jgi:hypothetical protein
MRLSDDQLKKVYGDEFPSAITVKGIRMPLARETRFLRRYYSEDPKFGAQHSRFMDGSAQITFPELQSEWPTWSDAERADFCDACSWMAGQPDFPDILRFVMQQTNPRFWTLVVSPVARHLPQAEAFAVLLNALELANGDHTANITQAIAATKHPDAPRVLREHLEALWVDARLWNDDPFTNWPAFDATCCIAHLIDLGVSPREFQERVRLLSEHPCEGNRQSCSTFLHRHYDWLPPPRRSQFGA